MSEDQLVLHPFMVMLVNLPVKKDAESKLWKCTLSNQDLTNDFTDFAPDLRQTVKIVYCKDGVRLRHEKAYAYANFAEYHDLVLFDQALKDQNRHLADYNRDHEQGRLRECMYGWAATMKDFNHLRSIGIAIKDQKTLKLSDIHAQEKMKDKQSKKELEDAQLQLINTKSRLAEVEEQMTIQIRKNKENELEYKQAEAELSQKRKHQKLALEEEQKKLSQLEADFENQIACIESKLQSREMFEKERASILIKKYEQQLAQRKLNRETQFLKEKSELESQQRQQYLTSFEHSMKERTRFEKEIKDLSDQMQRKNEDLTRQRTASLAQDLELIMKEDECCMCFLKFDPILTQDLQKEEGINAEEFDRLNTSEQYKVSKVWRNLAIPCLHAKFCGVCAQLVIDKAKKDTELDRNGKIHQPKCPICNKEVECFVPLRFATGTKRIMESTALP